MKLDYKTSDEINVTQSALYTILTIGIFFLAKDLQILDSKCIMTIEYSPILFKTRLPRTYIFEFQNFTNLYPS